VQSTSVYTTVLRDGIEEASLSTCGTAFRLHMRTETPPCVTALTTASTPRVAYAVATTMSCEKAPCAATIHSAAVSS